ncbi:MULTISPECIES: class I SAM-dependent methyltransferase [Mucilaginibacter]|jgi:2-polyprenyl-3-methyl-5-hydroxy-6-metoxy-1,4-benzoquinol methylase|uniref:Methyltransferase n=1 Tax=Mucilaginibacter agri TaxID=2695265 RepID=A0A965ZD20_9SPHI|nr:MULTISPECIES: class I SAM-dependent methyltransferase [Mucilaginibacter]NCD67799.1 methyltransferase [Mucilaginibacter agri]NHA05795.1 class I SAM-dependent methyltransferase [Mucilaginibacter inviolabilis]
MERKDHWENVYQTKQLLEVSWFEPIPETSVKIIEELGLSTDAAIIDIGGGDSLLADHLLALGYTNISVLDISSAAIERAKFRLGPKAVLIKWIVSDMLLFNGTEKFDVWHDRATFHFLTDPQDQQLYLYTVNKNLKDDGYLVLGTFSVKGPEKCSNLPVQQYSELTLTRLFSRYFKKINCFIKDHTTPFQTLQQFIFCVFQKNQ